MKPILHHLLKPDCSRKGGKQTKMRTVEGEIINEVMNELWLRQQYQQYPNHYEGSAAPWPRPSLPVTDAQPASAWINNLTQGPEKSILYGVGTLAVLGLLMPHFRQKMLAIVGRTATDGVELFDKARTIIARAKEDMEDLIAEADFRARP